MNRLANEPPFIVKPPPRRNRLILASHSAIISKSHLSSAGLVPFRRHDEPRSVPPTLVGGNSLEIVFRKLPPEPATKEDVKAIVKRAKDEVKSTIKRATEGADSGCHHRKKDRDALVQLVINYLAQPGVTFSIHNACKKSCHKTHKDDFTWLYDWCHRHEQKIHDAVDALRTR